MGLPNVTKKIVKATKQSYEKDGVAKVAAEGTTNVAQDVYVPEMNVVEDTTIGAAIPAIAKFFQRTLPGTSIPLGFGTRATAGANAFVRAFPKAGALALAYEVGSGLVGLINDLDKQIEEKERRKEELMNKYKSLAPAGMYTVPMNMFSQMGGF